LIVDDSTSACDWPTTTHSPAPQIQLLDFGALYIYLLTYLLTYLLLTFVDSIRQEFTNKLVACFSTGPLVQSRQTSLVFNSKYSPYKNRE